jgi:hypothetical protein
MISSEVPPYDISGAKKRKRSAIEVTESLTRANPVEYEDPYERLDGALQRAWTSVMDQDGHYKTSPFYRKVKCLLISWHKDCDDLDTEEEVSLAMPWGWIQLINQVSKLGSLLETKFNYKVKRALLGHDPRHDPFLQVTRSIVDFIWEEDGPNSLLMVYYAGHGAPKPRRGGRYDGLTLTRSGEF